MSEPLPRGAERDLFRDTWVRYLGECGGEGHGDSPTMWLERQGSPGAGQCPGEGGRVVVLILHGPERPGDLPKVTQLRSAQLCAQGLCWPVSQVNVPARLGGTG